MFNLNIIMKVYHGTGTHALASILKNGLKSNTGSLAFITTNFETAKEYALSYPNPIVLEWEIDEDFVDLIPDNCIDGSTVCEWELEQQQFLIHPSELDEYVIVHSI